MPDIAEKIDKELEKTFKSSKNEAAPDEKQRKLSYAEEVKDKGADGATFGLFWPEYEQEERKLLLVDPPKPIKVNKDPEEMEPQEASIVKLKIKKAASPPPPPPPPREPTP